MLCQQKLLPQKHMVTYAYVSVHFFRPHGFVPGKKVHELSRIAMLVSCEKPECERSTPFERICVLHHMAAFRPRELPSLVHHTTHRSGKSRRLAVKYYLADGPLPFHRFTACLEVDRLCEAAQIVS